MAESGLHPHGSSAGRRPDDGGRAAHAPVGGGGESAAPKLAQPVSPLPADRLLGVSPNAFAKASCLSEMPVFADLRPEERRGLDAAVAMKSVRKGQVIYRPGEAGEVFFLLKKGSVHLYLLSSGGRRLIVQTVGPMNFFGEVALLGQSMMRLFAEAAEDSLLCAMRAEDLKRLIRLKPEIGLRMLEEVGRRLYDAQERMGDLVFKKIRERIAKALLHLSGGGARAIRGTSQQEIADTLGVYRETVNNTLAELRDEGLIKIGRKQILILDPARLRRAAGEVDAPRERRRRASTAGR